MWVITEFYHYYYYFQLQAERFQTFSLTYYNLEIRGVWALKKAFSPKKRSYLNYETLIGIFDYRKKFSFF